MLQNSICGTDSVSNFTINLVRQGHHSRSFALFVIHGPPAEWYICQVLISVTKSKLQLLLSVDHTVALCLLSVLVIVCIVMYKTI